MAEICLDRSKSYSECHGDRTADDPHANVHFWQGFKHGKHNVLLPFDANGDLVPDDGRTDAYQGMVEGKPIMHSPLYTPLMRELVAKLKARSAKPDAAAIEAEDEAEEAPAAKPSEDGDEVNFTAWLRGAAKYRPDQLRKAGRARYSKNYPAGSFIPEMVRDLVLDEKLVPEEEVCGDLRRHLPEKAA